MRGEGRSSRSTMQISKTLGWLCVSMVVITSAYAQSAEYRLEQQLNLLRETLLDHETRLSEQQREIQNLQGEREVLLHKLEEVKKQQQDFYLEVEQRLKDLSVNPPPSSQRSEPADQTSVKSPPAGPIPFSGDDKQDYQEIFKMILKENYSEAITGFGSFLERYPQSEYASQALYWIGDAQYALKQENNALATFKALLEKYPTSPKNSQALLKIGYIYYEQKKFNDAKEVLKQVINNYPNTAVARLAEEKLQQIYRENPS